LGLSGAAWAVLLLNGCSGPQHPLQEDPLMVGPRAVRTPSSPSTPSGPSRPAVTVGTPRPLPDAPAPSNTTSPAALATTTPPVARDNPGAKDSASILDRPVVTPERKEPEQRVILREPEPVPGGPGHPLRASLDGRPNSVASSAITSYDQGVALLQQRGAKGQLKTLDDGSCRLRWSVPNRRKPNT